MIPSTTSKLLVSEDWKKLYQSFRNADFKSYDFETLRRTMIQYLQENFPEDFNDYIESSEYIALIDLIAFIGQNLSFRIDLNARENFLETAERRDSILRLAQLISYYPSRNLPANGLLKVVSISTTDNVFDLNGVNLAETTISWNDSVNPDWYQQFITILNSATTSVFGKSSSKGTIDGILTEQYRVNSSNIDTPIFNFNKAINGTNMSFEVVPCSFSGKDYIYEEAPIPGNSFSFLYRNDNQGTSSINTGFFCHFRQGTLSLSSFNINNPVPNEIIGVNTPDINNSDVWLWQLNKQGNFDTLWTRVPAVTGNNIIYNSLQKNLKTIYSITSRTSDQIDINFADGVFGDLPKGQFRLFYRQSNGLSYVIKPEQLSGIVISIPYLNKSGQQNTLQMTLSLQYAVNNSSGAETNSQIQFRAPQTYYLQNRMITGEDYNIAPLNASSDILKVKSVNRVSSGVSKYFDLSDVSGRYSKTNIFGNDGVIYKEESESTSQFEYVSKTQVFSYVKNTLAEVVNSQPLRAFYFDKFSKPNLESLNLRWKEVNKTPGQSRGYFYNENGSFPVGSNYTDNNLKYVQPGSIVKFLAPNGKYFDESNNLQFIDSSKLQTLGFDILDFVNTTKGSYNYDSYYIKTLNILPLYTSNNEFTTNIGIKYGLYRDPDYDGLAYWVKEAINNGKSIEDIDFRTGFFTAALQYASGDRANVKLKPYFTASGTQATKTPYQLTQITNSIPIGGRSYIWATVSQVIDNGADVLIDGTGPIIFNTRIPSDAVPAEVLPKYPDILPYSIETEIVNTCSLFKNFGLTLNEETREWDFITSANLNTVDEFSLGFQNSQGSQSLDSSWLISFVWTGINYQIRYRILNYIFESVQETSFYVDKTTKNYDYTNNTVVKDKISILNINTTPDASAFNAKTLGTSNEWQIDDVVIEEDGFIKPNRVKVSLLNFNNQGIFSNPNSFQEIVGDFYVFFKRTDDGLTYSITDTDITILDSEDYFTDIMKVDGSLYFFKDTEVVKYWSNINSALIFSDLYFGRKGRRNLKFQYVHNSGDQRRLDPSKSNIIDIYLLTRNYDTSFRSYIIGNLFTEPLVPTSSSLEQNYSQYLEPIKAMSDEIIFHPVKYKILFGDKAPLTLQCTFKAVRNSSRITNDNNLKTRILSAIDDFFSLENWEFGQTFYFGELSAYVMNLLSPDINNFILVPKNNIGFGSLLEVTCLSNELFVNGAGIDNIEIIDAITAAQLQTNSTIVTSV